ncbi:hypothetical protein D3C71_128940 [compost metagenome]
MIKTEIRHYSRTIFIIIAMLMVILLPEILPKEQRSIVVMIRVVFFTTAIVLYGIYFYRNRKDWVKLLIQAFSIVLLSLVIMKISKPMLDDAYKYKPERSTKNKNP